MLTRAATLFLCGCYSTHKFPQCNASALPLSSLQTILCPTAGHFISGCHYHACYCAIMLTKLQLSQVTSTLSRHSGNFRTTRSHRCGFFKNQFMPKITFQNYKQVNHEEPYPKATNMKTILFLLHTVCRSE